LLLKGFLDYKCPNGRLCDGFNFYYGPLSTPIYKWVKLQALCLQILAGLSINRINYFTALLKPLPSNPQASSPNFTVHYGHYLQSDVAMPLAAPWLGGPRFSTVRRMEEKVSDVNIAT
jgi:hypothetical protein